MSAIHLGSSGINDSFGVAERLTAERAYEKRETVGTILLRGRSPRGDRAPLARPAVLRLLALRGSHAAVLLVSSSAVLRLLALRGSHAAMSQN